MTTQDDVEVIQGREARPDEIEMYRWAEDAQRNAGKVASEALQRLVTLTTALLAGTAALITKGMVPFWAQAGGAVLLLAALAMALYGSLPRAGMVRINYLDEVRQFREDNARIKMEWLALASCALFLALVVFVAGLLVASYTAGR